MNKRKFTLTVLIVTFFAFFLSYASSVLGNLNSEKPYPESLFKKYSRDLGQKEKIKIEKEISAVGVRTLKIKTVVTDIHLVPSDSPKVSLLLEGRYPLRNQDPESALKIENQDGVISIETVEKGVNLATGFQLDWESDDGSLTIRIPKTVAEVTVGSVSGVVSGELLNLEKLEATEVSEKIQLSELRVKDLQLKTVSGNAEISGNITHVGTSMISGDLDIEFENDSPQAEIKSTSGNVHLEFQSNNPDAKVQFKSVSGNIQVDSKDMDSDFGGQQMEFTLGHGKGQITIKTISGDVQIE